MSRLLLTSKGCRSTPTESISPVTALGSTRILPTLKPVPLESPSGLPPSLSHAWGVHSTSIPIDSCALVVYSSYLGTSVLYSDGFMNHCISWSRTVIVYLASSTKEQFTNWHFAVVPYHDMAHCRVPYTRYWQIYRFSCRFRLVQ